MMMKKNNRKLGAPSFRVALATRKALAAVLAVCMLLTLLPMAALAVDEPAHSHAVSVGCSATEGE